MGKAARLKKFKQVEGVEDIAAEMEKKENRHLRFFRALAGAFEHEAGREPSNGADVLDALQNFICFALIRYKDPMEMARLLASGVEEAILANLKHGDGELDPDLEGN
jgi:hypothetical protein